MSQKWRSLWFSVTKERSKEKQMQKQQNVSKRGKENQFWWSRKMQSLTGKRKMFTGNSQHQIRNETSFSISYQKWKLTRLSTCGVVISISVFIQHPQRRSESSSLEENQNAQIDWAVKNPVIWQWLVIFL